MYRPDSTRHFPGAVVEPTCDQGAFLVHFPAARHVLGLEINAAYVQEVRMRLGRAARVDQGDFFTLDWDAVLSIADVVWPTMAAIILTSSASIYRLDLEKKVNSYYDKLDFEGALSSAVERQLYLLRRIP